MRTSQRSGRQPIIVGGLAVAYWSAGLEPTSDIDVVMVGHEPLDDRLMALGLQKVGRFWATEDRRVVFECPAGVLDPGWEAIDAESPSGRPLRVLSLEDTIVSRMAEVDSGGHLMSWNQRSHSFAYRDSSGVGWKNARGRSVWLMSSRGSIGPQGRSSAGASSSPTRSTIGSRHSDVRLRCSYV